ncbi:hypothetical protein QFC20_005946 [Naganishia adeliensis]|uniref:Uncharacterized protein n=1 Tax=Naganishia adeliensis TaxID=92952 RepID=A0ACC2VHQ8_9TREE|nr:hypothetical protein QFC20_005946 [Naganishia adeliensis]
MSVLSDKVLQSLSRIHKTVTDPSTNSDAVLAQLQTCPEDVRDVVLGSLVWLYSHWSTSTDEASWTQEKARRAMVLLGSAMQRLPAEERIALNPWQQHLLQHFHRLAPFPLSTTTQDEIITAIWGPAWSATLDLRTRSRHFEVYDLALLSRDLGIGLERVRSELRSVQRDEEGLRMLSVQTVDMGGKVLAMEGMEEGKTERPGMVALVRWGDLPTGRTLAGEGFTSSGRPAVEEKTYTRHAETLIRFGKTKRTSPYLPAQPVTDERTAIRPSPPMVDKPMYEKPPTLSDVKPVIRVPNSEMEEVIDLCDIPDSPPRSQRRYVSPPPSKSPPPIEPGMFEHAWEVAGRKRDEMLEKVAMAETAHAVKPTAPVWRPAVTEQQVFMVHDIDVRKEAVDAVVARRSSPRPVSSSSLARAEQDGEGASGDSGDHDHTTSRSSTTVYASPLPGTSAASSPIDVQPASERRKSPSPPTREPTSSGHRKRSVASEDEDDVPQKRFKGSADRPAHSPRRSRSPPPSDSDSEDGGSATSALWRQVLSDPTVARPRPPTPLPKAEPVKEEPNVKERDDPSGERRDTSVVAEVEVDVLRIVDTCIANVTAQLPVLRIGWEMVLVMACTSDGEIVFHRGEVERSPSTSAPANHASEEDLRRFNIHAHSLRNDVRLLRPGKQLTFKIARGMDGGLKYSTTFQKFRDDAAPW